MRVAHSNSALNFSRSDHSLSNLILFSFPLRLHPLFARYFPIASQLSPEVLRLKAISSSPHFPSPNIRLLPLLLPKRSVSMAAIYSINVACCSTGISRGHHACTLSAVVDEVKTGIKKTTLSWAVKAAKDVKERPRMDRPCAMPAVQEKEIAELCMRFAERVLLISREELALPLPARMP
eukprot:IDg7516t1